MPAQIGEIRQRHQRLDPRGEAFCRAFECRLRGIELPAMLRDHARDHQCVEPIGAGLAHDRQRAVGFVDIFVIEFEPGVIGGEAVVTGREGMFERGKRGRAVLCGQRRFAAQAPGGRPISLAIGLAQQALHFAAIAAQQRGFGGQVGHVRAGLDQRSQPRQRPARAIAIRKRQVGVDQQEQHRHIVRIVFEAGEHRGARIAVIFGGIGGFGARELRGGIGMRTAGERCQPRDRHKQCEKRAFHIRSVMHAQP